MANRRCNWRLPLAAAQTVYSAARARRLTIVCQPARPLPDVNSGNPRFIAPRYSRTYRRGAGSDELSVAAWEGREEVPEDHDLVTGHIVEARNWLPPARSRGRTDSAANKARAPRNRYGYRRQMRRHQRAERRPGGSPRASYRPYSCGCSWTRRACRCRPIARTASGDGVRGGAAGRHSPVRTEAPPAGGERVNRGCLLLAGAASCVNPREVKASRGFHPAATSTSKQEAAVLQPTGQCLRLHA